MACSHDRQWPVAVEHFTVLRRKKRQNLVPKYTKIHFFRGSARTPLGVLTALPRPHSWWGGGWLPPPQEPHPRSQPFGLRASAFRASLCPPTFWTVVTPMHITHLVERVWMWADIHVVRRPSIIVVPSSRATDSSLVFCGFILVQTT